MKSFTCSELGGPCEEEISGGTMEEVASMAGAHIRQAGDARHKELAKTLESATPEKQGLWMLWFKTIWDNK